MSLSWNQLPRATWDAFHAQHGGSLQQSWAYGEAMHGLGVKVHRAALTERGELRGLAQFICRRVAGYLGLAACSRGPVWAPAVDGPSRARACRALKRSIPVRPLRVVLFSPNDALEDLRPGEMHPFSRVMTGDATVVLDLRRGPASLRADLDHKWRNRLVKAEADQALRIEVQADHAACMQLLQRETEQREQRGFQGLPTALVPAYIAAHDRPSQAYVVSAARLGQEPAAAMLFLIHGRGATYHMGWSSEEGRRLNLHNLLLWRAVEHLHGRGLAQLDLGGVNTHDLPGISRFKLGTGGRVLALAGTYF